MDVYMLKYKTLNIWNVLQNMKQIKYKSCFRVTELVTSCTVPHGRFFDCTEYSVLVDTQTAL